MNEQNQFPANVGFPIEANTPHADAQFVDLAPHYDELMQTVPYSHWAEYVLLLWEVHGHKARRVLDCACGTGNLSFELARHDLQVTGVDLSAPMIEQAQRKSKTQTHLKHPVHFVQGDLTNFDLGQSFDAATCLYDSLNYLTEPAALLRAMKCVRAHVEADGVWIFDMNSDWAFHANLFSQSNRDPRKQLHYGWQANFDPATRLCTVSMRFDKQRSNGTTETFYETHRERAYLLSEVEELIAQSGWTLLRSYDAYTLNRPHDRSERWFFAVRNGK